MSHIAPVQLEPAASKGVDGGWKAQRKGKEAKLEYNGSPSAANDDEQAHQRLTSLEEALVEHNQSPKAIVELELKQPQSMSFIYSYNSATVKRRQRLWID